METKDIFGTIVIVAVIWGCVRGIQARGENKRIELTHLETLKFTDVLSKALQENKDAMTEAVVALAAQKSQILVQNPDTGEVKIMALDTASKDFVREYLERNKKQLQEGDNAAHD